MRPAGISIAYLEVDTLSIKTLVDVRQAALDNADRLLELHARAQRARCHEAGQRARCLPVQPGLLLAAVQPLQVGLQLCNEPVLAILTCQHTVKTFMRSADTHSSGKHPDLLWGLLIPLWKSLRVVLCRLRSS